IELAIRSDIRAFELTDFAGPHPGENADQKSPVNVRLHEILTRLPDVHAVLASGEQRLLE
ncbi:hypothetical protein, partial [Bradyrhizobium sp. NAS80.1]|uniref:hypothetical protein n=1 Tax=Bradyrhizobium sp. NAS80.1 TaxID=1680159 RepID=UPI001AF014B3